MSVETRTAERATQEAATASRRPMREDDLLRFVWIADPEISPDGTRVAFTRVWVDAEGDEYRTQLWLAFVRRAAGGKTGQIHVLPMEGGEAVAVTALEGGGSDPAWSPDGRRIAFLSPHNPALDGPDRKKPKHEPGRVVTRPVFRENEFGFYDHHHRDHVWVVDRDGGAPRALTTGRLSEASPRWSRDGRWIYLVSDRRDEPWFGPEESKLWAVPPDLDTPTDGAELKLVVDMRGAIVAYAEAEDGAIAVIGSISREPRSYDQPGLFLARGQWPREGLERLASGYDFPFGEVINSDQHPPRGGGACPLAVRPDGAVVARAGQHGSSLLVLVEGERVTELTAPGFDLAAGTATPCGRRWALTVATPLSPGVLRCFDLETRAWPTLCAPNPWLSEVDLGEVEEFWFPSFDVCRIQAWLVRPPGFDPERKYPMILEIHGGPHTAYGHGFFHEFHVLAGAGYLVLYTNPRGSTTYGQEFGNVIQYRFPGDDAQDLLAGVEAVVRRGGVDEQRIGVTGGSGGGLLTNWLIAHSDRFAAAVTQRCVSDWPGFYYSADFAMFTPFWFKQPPFEDPEDYRRRSPVAFASRITTPLMVIHSEEDWRTSIGQGEAIFRALKQQRKPTVMVRFPGENHELSRSGVPSRRVQNQEHIRRWFDRWLAGKPAPEYGV